MYIYKETESSNYWHDGNQQNIKLESACINNNIMARNESPSEVHSQPDMCYKTENVYQYCDRNFNFSALTSMNVTTNVGMISEDDEYSTYPPHKRKMTTVTRDPMSHRIIEKRRRDRMNNCLADLSRLIPAEYLKKGRGRIEKTEIIEMAIKYMKYLQSRLYNNIDKCDLRNKTINAHDYSSENGQQCSNENTFQSNDLIFKKGYQLGFQECLSEVMHYLVEAEGYYPEEKMCVRLMNHLENQCDRILKGDRLVNQNRVDTLTPPTNCDPKITVDNNIYATHSDGEIAYGEINRPVRKGIIIPAPSMRKSNASSCDDIANLNIRSSIVGSDGSERIQISQNQIENNGGGQDNIGTESNSQLREILTGPAHINNVFASQARPNIIRKLPVESKSVVHHNVIMNNEQNATAGNSLYKFKNNIKERFSAEHSSNGVVISGAEMCAIKKKRRLSTDDSSVNSDQTLNDTPPPPSVKQMRESSPSIPSHPVPIFALHAKGAFYVPLTIDSELLGPFLTDLSTDLNVNTFSSLVLHPVTISVNFQRQVMQPIKPFESVLSSPEWPEPRGKIMSMSKWSSCINI